MSGAVFEVEGLRLRRGGLLLLDGGALRLGRGERVALLGPNGAGKSSLLRALVGLDRAEAGTIRAFGAPMRGEADFREARRRVGVLLQDPDDQLFCPTVIEDVAFGPLNLGMTEAEAFARAQDTLARLALDHLAERVTHRLSGGEKRLAALAGVLAMRPDALLLDEPTNALDEENHARMLDLLDGLDAAMLIVSHDPRALARLPRRAVRLRDGALEEVASPLGEISGRVAAA
ncbi:MAG: energy-coupling factor ABC transporter ATP-binding protein [Rubrimonas sp.]|uniref:energy-coupling factor ABC transporter ATP-binding protein n=1 Tax=Rubrimonas sp. TaxID=2036015 RepID=UPI002FDC89DB